MSSKLNDDVTASVYANAQRFVQHYVQGLISVDSLAIQMLNEVHTKRSDDTVPLQRMLTRIAQRVCSRVLYDAWRSSDAEQRNLAFVNLRSSLEWLLLHSSYAKRLQTYTGAIEDVLHSTLEILSILEMQKNAGGPDDPAAFLKWTQTILFRQAYAFLERASRDAHLSLDEQVEFFAEQFVDTHNRDPLDEALTQEVQRTLVDVLLSLRNSRYRQVLFATYLMDLDEQEVAQRLGVTVQEVYMWRYRGLKALRQQPTILHLLRALRE